MDAFLSRLKATQQAGQGKKACNNPVLSWLNEKPAVTSVPSPPPIRRQQSPPAQPREQIVHSWPPRLPPYVRQPQQTSRTQKACGERDVVSSHREPKKRRLSRVDSTRQPRGASCIVRVLGLPVASTIVDQAFAEVASKHTQRIQQHIETVKVQRELDPGAGYDAKFVKQLLLATLAEARKKYPECGSANHLNQVETSFSAALSRDIRSTPASYRSLCSAVSHMLQSLARTWEADRMQRQKIAAIPANVARQRRPPSGVESDDDDDDDDSGGIVARRPRRTHVAESACEAKNVATMVPNELPADILAAAVAAGVEFTRHPANSFKDGLLAPDLLTAAAAAGMDDLAAFGCA